jgi:hypothetical protein
MNRAIVSILFTVTLWSDQDVGAQVASTARLPDAHINLHVLDQDGNAVSDASVGVAGTVSPKLSSARLQEVRTDPTGAVDVHVKSNGAVHINVQKPGYYRTEVTPAYDFEETHGNIDTAFTKGRWQPDPLTLKVVIKQVVNPIPMYAQRVNRAVPAQNEDLGFDMFVGDFVTPYGHGRTADMTFRLEVSERAKKDYDYRLNVVFPNRLDGILPFDPSPHLKGSLLRSGYSAPDRGFLPGWSVTRVRRPGSAEQSNYDPEKHGYYIRIRTVTDNGGKILSANYGKIYGDFMNFTYYVNPTPNDRNVEFDPKRNLFTNLKADERVTEP